MSSATRNALSELLIRTGAELFTQTQFHLFACPCQHCRDYAAIWNCLGVDDRHELLASVPDLFKPAPEPKPADDELLRAAIDSVIAREDDEAWPDISKQIVCLILAEDEFEPLRQRIFSSLFDC